jgi:RNA polymerase sigma-70 factor (ECF subfamily)
MIAAHAQGAWQILSQQLRPFIARRVSAAADVDDVLQDVFLRMHRSLPSLRDGERFGPWAYQVTRSAIADHHRSAARQERLEDAAGLAAPSSPASSSDAEPEGAAERELAAYMAPLVAMLPSPYREALVLTELEGMTQKAAAELLGISLSGMKTRVQRGRVRLRALLESCCEIALDARGRVIACDPRRGSAPDDCRCKSG